MLLCQWQRPNLMLRANSTFYFHTSINTDFLCTDVKAWNAIKTIFPCLCLSLSQKTRDFSETKLESHLSPTSSMIYFGTGVLVAWLSSDKSRCQTPLGTHLVHDVKRYKYSFILFWNETECVYIVVSILPLMYGGYWRTMILLFCQLLW